MQHAREGRQSGIGIVAGVAAATGLIATIGCTDDARIAVSGTATHQGRPVPGLYLCFEGDHASSPPAWSVTDADGRFQVWGSGQATGIAPGTYRVWVDFRVPEPAPGGDTLPAVKREWVNRYRRATSPLTVVIDRACDNLQLAFD